MDLAVYRIGHGWAMMDKSHGVEVSEKAVQMISGKDLALVLSLRETFLMAWLG